MLRRTDAGVGLGSVRLPELSTGDASQAGPEPDRPFQIQPGVKVQVQPQPRLFHREEASEPAAEERDHAWVAVGEADGAVPFRAFAGVEGHPGNEELPLAEACDADTSFGAEAVDLRLLGQAEPVGAPVGGAAPAVVPGPAGPRRLVDRDVAHPQRHRAATHAQLVADLGVGPPIRPKLASPGLR
ncbi:MAG: hypothetical protein LC808_08850 [Actinobacteria bacterium]|nr:hypothetical protein [Actinomycetota bacterium]